MVTESPLLVAPAKVLAECWCLNAQRAARRLARLYDDGLRPHGLTHGQFSLLMLVAGMQPAPVSQLADALVMDRTTVTAALKPLERRKLLSSASAEADQRQRLISLTPSGRRLLAAASVAWQQLQDDRRRERPPAMLRASLRQLTSNAKDRSR
jgi:DNA-binding MarR family transcriptional regulator